MTQNWQQDIAIGTVAVAFYLNEQRFYSFEIVSSLYFHFS